MGKKSAPAPPNYAALEQQKATEQQGLLAQQTWANRANQYNPWGQQTWSSSQAIDPATGKPVTQWEQRTTLDPNLQRSLDAQFAAQAGGSELAQQKMAQMQGQLGQPIDTSGFAGWGGGPQAGNLQAITNPYGFGVSPQDIDTSRMAGSGDYRQRAEDAIYQSAASRLDPQWGQRQSDMEAQLANQGITRNSAAFEREMGNFTRQRTAAYQQAQMGAITGGGAEAQRNFAMDQGAREQQLAAQQAMFGQGLQSGQFGLYGQQQAFGQQQAAGAQNFQQQLAQSQYANQLRQQQLQEQMGLRNQGLNEYSALLSGSQVGMPQFGNYTQAGQGMGADLTGAAAQDYQGQMDAFSQKQAGRQAAIGAAASIAGAVFV